MILRGYQREDLDRLRDAFRLSRSVLYQLPTGGGKTVVYATIAQRVAANGGRVLILEHRRELVAQAVDKLRALGVDVGITAAGVADPSPGAPVRVAMVQTLARRADDWRADFVVADEAHLAAAKTWRDLLLNEHGSAWRLGVTATPVRLDGKPLGDLFGALVAGPTVAQLQAAGHLVDEVVYSIPGADLSAAKVTRGEFRAVDAAAAMDRPKLVGDVVQHYQRLADGRTGIVYAASVAHAQRVADAFVAAGVPAAAISGSTPTAQRDATLRSLADRSDPLRIVVNCGVLTEGFDCPRVSYIGFARPTASLALYLQVVGRGLRPAPGKADCIVADHAGNALRFGLPSQDRQWSLDGKRKRGKQGEDEAALSVRTCAQCLAVWAVALSGTACPRCGTVAPVTTRRLRQLRGQLQRVTKADIARAARAASKDMPPRPAPSWAVAEIWDRCEAKRQREGYAPGWTIGVVQRLQRGVWR